MAIAVSEHHLIMTVQDTQETQGVLTTVINVITTVQLHFQLVFARAICSLGLPIYYQFQLCFTDFLVDYQNVVYMSTTNIPSQKNMNSMSIRVLCVTNFEITNTGTQRGHQQLLMDW